jgi:phosphoribosylglycinamide formyltransferase-1
MKKRLVVLVSGAGTILNAIAKAIESGIIKNARIDAVITNKRECGASEVAKRNGLVPYVIIPKDFGHDTDWYGKYSDEEHSGKILGHAKRNRHKSPSLVVKTCKLVVTPEWEGKILNIHPSLLPKYGGKGMYGLHVYQAVMAAKEKWTGSTVHVVDNEYDHGMILAQTRVPVREDDTLVSLASRVQEAERIMYPQVIQSYLEGKWS